MSRICSSPTIWNKSHFILLETTNKASPSSVIESISPFKIKSSVGPYKLAPHIPENSLMFRATKEQEKEIYCKLSRELTDIQEEW